MEIQYVGKGACGEGAAGYREDVSGTGSQLDCPAQIDAAYLPAASQLNRGTQVPWLSHHAVCLLGRRRSSPAPVRRHGDASRPQFFDPSVPNTPRSSLRGVFSLVGMDDLTRLGQRLYGDQDPLAVLYRGEPMRVETTGDGYVLTMRCPSPP